MALSLDQARAALAALLPAGGTSGQKQQCRPRAFSGLRSITRGKAATTNLQAASNPPSPRFVTRLGEVDARMSYNSRRD
jgi:hypothetical protein